MTPDILRIALENVDFRLPTQVTDDNSVTALKSLAFEPLLRWRPHGVVKPGLFFNWEHSPDGRTWRFQIRSGATFHDGKPCTAADVVSFIHGLLDSRDYFGMRWSYSRYFAHATVSAEDERTMRVESAEPFADILGVLCEFWPSRLDEAGKPILGTGPYQVVSFERDAGIGSAKFHRLRGEGPQVIIASMEPNAAKRLQLLRDGHVDAALNLERVEDLNLVDWDPSLRWDKTISTLSAMYYLNCTSGIFQSPKARLAVNLAVDSAALVKQVYYGHATPSTTIVSSFHLGGVEAQLQPIPYDPAAAKELLRDLDTSTPLVLRTPTFMPEHAQKISTFVASSLRAVGFEVQVKVEANRPEYARQIGLQKEIGDLALFDSTPNSTFRVLDDKISSVSKNTWWLGYHDDEVQRLFGAARNEVASEDRARAYAECLKRLHENPPWLYIAHPHVIWATRSGVCLRIGHSGVLTLGDDR